MPPTFGKEFHEHFTQLDLIDSLFIAADFQHVQLSAEALHGIILHKKSLINHPSTLPLLPSHTYQKAIPTGTFQLCGMKDTTSVSLYITLPRGKDHSLHETLVWRMAIELLAGFEGPLWRAIRGKGLSYDFGLYVFIYLFIYL